MFSSVFCTQTLTESTHVFKHLPESQPLHGAVKQSYCLCSQAPSTESLETFSLHALPSFQDRSLHTVSSTAKSCSQAPHKVPLLGGEESFHAPPSFQDRLLQAVSSTATSFSQAPYAVLQTLFSTTYSFSQAPYKKIHWGARTPDKNNVATTTALKHLKVKPLSILAQLLLAAQTCHAESTLYLCTSASVRTDDLRRPGT